MWIFQCFKMYLIEHVGCSKHVWFEQVLRALPAETMVDGLPRVSSFIQIRSLGEKLGPNKAKWFENIKQFSRNFKKYQYFASQSLLYEVPSGNQVDGLPLAASTGATMTCRPMQLIICPDFLVFVALVLLMFLVDFHENFRNHRYIYDLYSDQAPSLSINLSRSWC